MDLVATVLDGILLGGVYALFASGLSLIFGVMRLVNIAHGDLIVLSAFITLVVTTHFGVHPLVSLVLVVPLMALLGYVDYVFRDIVVTIYPSGLCRVLVRAPGIFSKCTKSHTT
jgi:branched-subunit amino acid ABC-type transport system permease component